MRSLHPHGEIVVCLWLCFCTSGWTQQPVWEQWHRTYNGPGNDLDYITDSAVDQAGNVYVTGWSVGAGTNYDYATIKYGLSGSQIWQARYQGPLYDKALAIAVDGQQNAYVTGYSYDPTTLEDYLTIKYNAVGVQQWTARYNGTGNGNDEPLAIAVDAAGNVYLTGRSDGAGTLQDYTTILYNSTGTELWVARYASPGAQTDEALALALDGNGNVLVTGRSATVTSSFDYVTIQYNAEGEQQWLDRYDGSAQGVDQAYDLKVDAWNNVYVTGESAGLNTLADCATIKYDSTGLLLWVARYDAVARSDVAQALALDAAGMVYITGYSDTTWDTTSTGDMLTIKYSPQGVQQWSARHDSPLHGEDHARGICLDVAGNAYVTGYSVNSGSYRDILTLKYSPAGVLQWQASYSSYGAQWDEGACIAWSPFGNVYVAGYTTGLTSQTDYLTLQYAETPPDTLIVELIPHNVPVIIPSSGGAVIFDVSLFNNTSYAQNFDVWTQVYAPNGFWIGPLLGPVNLTLLAGATISRTRTQVIPSNAPSGNYTYCCQVGDYPNVIWAEDSFPFVKTGIRNGGLGFSDWNHPELLFVEDDLEGRSVVPLQSEDMTLTAYPNPFNAGTMIRFSWPQGGWVKLEVYDIRGRLVETNPFNRSLGSMRNPGMPLKQWYPAGTHEIPFNGSQLPSGIYLCRLLTEDQIFQRKIVLIK